MIESIMINLNDSEQLLPRQSSVWLQTDLYFSIGKSLIQNKHGDEFQIALRYHDIADHTISWRNMLIDYYRNHRHSLYGVIY